MGDDNVVLYYKPQGADDDKTGLKRDFLIVLQTPIQAEMLKKFADRGQRLSVLLQHMALMHTTLSYSHC